VPGWRRSGVGAVVVGVVQGAVRGFLVVEALLSVGVVLPPAGDAEGERGAEREEPEETLDEEVTDGAEADHEQEHDGRTNDGEDQTIDRGGRLADDPNDQSGQRDEHHQSQQAGHSVSPEEPADADEEHDEGDGQDELGPVDAQAGLEVALPLGQGTVANTAELAGHVVAGVGDGSHGELLIYGACVVTCGGYSSSVLLS
jgi:hypothetical protein